MFAAIVTVTISVVMAGIIAMMFCDREATNEIVNWDGQRQYDLAYFRQKDWSEFELLSFLSCRDICRLLYEEAIGASVF